jgi:hypothetical protein
MAEESRNIQSNFLPNDTFFTINPTWTHLGMKPRLRDKKPATKCLSHGMAVQGRFQSEFHLRFNANRAGNTLHISCKKKTRIFICKAKICVFFQNHTENTFCMHNMGFLSAKCSDIYSNCYALHGCVSVVAEECGTRVLEYDMILPSHVYPLLRTQSSLCLI